MECDVTLYFNDVDPLYIGHIYQQYNKQMRDGNIIKLSDILQCKIDNIIVEIGRIELLHAPCNLKMLIKMRVYDQDGYVTATEKSEQ